jgi:hypothetical protein
MRPCPRLWSVALVIAVCLSLVIPIAASADTGTPGTPNLIAVSASASPPGDALPLVRGANRSRAQSGPFTLVGPPGSSSSTFVIKFENTGTATWTIAGGYYLHDTFGGSYSLGNPVSQGGCDGLPPLWSCSWSFYVTFGSVPGTYIDYWRMQHGAKPFGATITETVIVT